MQGSSREVSAPRHRRRDPEGGQIFRLPQERRPKNPLSSSSSGRPSPTPRQFISDLVPDGGCTDGTIEIRRTMRRGDDNSRDDVLDDPPGVLGYHQSPARPVRQDEGERPWG